MLPLGTGNDLSQVLGWGDVFNDDAKVPTLLEQYACAKTKMLDRWSIMVYEGVLPELPPQIFDKPDEKEKYEEKIGNQYITPCLYKVVNYTLESRTSSTQQIQR